MFILTRNKMEDRQLQLGICTLAGPWVPVTRALRDHVMGIDRTSDGHLLPVLWASSAHFMGWFLGTILSKRIRIFSICSWLQFCVFVQCFMVIWWYFYRNVSGSSHHFPEKYRKLEKNSWKFVSLISFCYICIRKYQYIEDKGWYNG